MRHFLASILVILVAPFLTGCFGSSSSSSGSGSVNGDSGTSDASPGGYYAGAQTIPGEGSLNLLGIVTEDGRFHFVREDGAQYFGNVSVSGQNATGSYQGVLAIGDQFPDGSNSGSGSLDLHVDERASIEGDFTFTTDQGTTDEGTIELMYDDGYERESSFATISGNYTDADEPNRDALSIDDTGMISYQDWPTNCVGNGQVDLIDENFNAYEVEFTFNNCDGDEAVLNGETFTGLATLDDSFMPEELILGLTGNTAGHAVSLVAFYARND